MRRRAGSAQADQPSDGQSRAGRSPAATWRFSSAWTRARSSGWVTPMQRPSAGSTVKELVAEGFGHHLGQQHLVLLGGVDGGVHGGLEGLVEGRGEAPQVHRDPGVAGTATAGSRPSPATKPPSGSARDLAPLVHPEEPAVGADPADAAGDRGEADDGVGQSVAHQARWSSPLALQVLGQQRAAGDPVDVVGVAHAVGGIADVLGRARAQRRPCREARAGGRSGRRPRRATCAPRDSGWPVRCSGPSTRTMVANPARQRIGSHEVDDRFAVRAHRRQRLAAAVSLGPPGRQDDQRRARAARRPLM